MAEELIQFVVSCCTSLSACFGHFHVAHRKPFLCPGFMAEAEQAQCVPLVALGILDVVGDGGGPHAAPTVPPGRVLLQSSASSGMGVVMNASISQWWVPMRT